MLNWQEKALPKGSEAIVAALVGAGMSPLFAELLALRGITAETAKAFLSPLKESFGDPHALPGIDAAAAVIYAAIRRREPIVVFGDYDCDGVSATAILVGILRKVASACAERAGAGILPCSVDYFIPRRLSEGYGMSEASVRRLLAEFPAVKLVVTVDNGINAVEHVAALKSRGIRVVITDHHLPGETLPAAEATVDPKVAAPETMADLCGAGVAFMLAWTIKDLALKDGCAIGKVGFKPIVLAGLATITDIMPVRGINRVLVANALERFHAFAPVGLRELYLHASPRAAEKLTSKDFGFVLGPRINAAGRMAEGVEALKLVLEDDREKARLQALTIDALNQQRKETESAMSAEALKQVVTGAPAQVIHIPEGHQGVAGIVASRILEKCPSGPVAVIVGQHGSCRAPSGFNVRDVLLASAEVLTRFGGHAQAGGFSVKEGRIEDFRRLFLAAAAAQAETLRAAGSPPEVVLFDREVEGTEFTLELVSELEKLEPYGEGNEEPLFCMRRVSFSQVKPIGGECRHLQLQFNRHGCPRAVWWGHGDAVEGLRATCCQPHDVLFRVGISDYGTRHVEFRLVAVEPSDAA